MRAVSLCRQAASPYIAAMGAEFLKMHGLGNDFAVFDHRGRPGFRPGPAALRLVADRRFGIGCDQVIAIEAPKAGGDAFMRIWNPDGSEGSHCGNAARCIPALLMEETGKDVIRLELLSGMALCRKAGGGRITVDMGVPRLSWEEIPLAERMDTRRIDIKLGPLDAPYLWGPGAVNMGNPHAVFFVEDAARIALEKVGPLVENHPLFPDRANVSIAQVLAPDHVLLRVWERGAGATLACGTAACATLVAGVRRNLLARAARIDLPGGTLEIEWRESDSHVLKTGPWALTARGQLDGALASAWEAGA